MNTYGWDQSELVRRRQRELLGESERERLAGYGLELAAQPGPASLLLAAWLRAAADQLAPASRPLVQP
jgi:hypothetical protein